MEQNNNMMENRIELNNLQTRSEFEGIAKTYCKTTQEDLMPLIKQNSNVINQCEAEISSIP